MTVSTMQVGQAATITFTAYSDGTQTDLGTITIGIVDANGDTVVASGTAVTDNSDGTYEYTVAKQSEPNFLTATWSVAGGADFTTYIDVQGSVLFNEAQLRGFDDQAISDTTAYTDAAIAETHQRVIERMEAFTGRAWVRRYNRMVLPGSGSRFLALELDKSVTAAGITLNRPGATQDIISPVIRANDGAAVTVGNITVLPGGILQRTDAAWTQAQSDSPLNVTIEYEYGQPYPVDAADRIGMLIARHWLVGSRIPSHASSFNDALGTYGFDETRLPLEAWQWLKDHRIQGFFA